MVRKEKTKIYNKRTDPEHILKNTVTKLKLISFILKKKKDKKAKNIEYIAKKLEEELWS